MATCCAGGHIRTGTTLEGLEVERDLITLHREINGYIPAKCYLGITPPRGLADHYKPIKDVKYYDSISLFKSAGLHTFNILIGHNYLEN